ncbi:DUF4440 domain-containing protein [Flavobacterium sp. LS1P3]|jgi:hypothetical protein|uniref:DUF4440 domain-containing protein n=1 Tax=Flavobacterium sp. LS1P3 TaxID=3401720 RepID=UPI003AB0836A
MKHKIKIILLITFLVNIKAMAQSKSEIEILTLSSTIFKWEVENKIDLLENIFDEKFVVVGGDGSSQNKTQYITLLRSGNFEHNSIDITEQTATVVNNTATVVGKGRFTVTISGNKITLLLSYIEVFTRPNAKKPWKILAMHATVLEK